MSKYKYFTPEQRLEHGKFCLVMHGRTATTQVIERVYGENFDTDDEVCKPFIVKETRCKERSCRSQ